MKAFDKFCPHLLLAKFVANDQMMEEELEKVSLFFHGVLVAHGKVVAWGMFRQ